MAVLGVLLLVVGVQEVLLQLVDASVNTTCTVKITIKIIAWCCGIFVAVGIVFHADKQLYLILVDIQLNPRPRYSI
jgi:hypothetical protein